MIFNLLVAVILDFLIGDPYSFPHPVKLMGNIIKHEEALVRKFIKASRPLKLAGGIIVAINLVLGFTVPFLILTLVEGNPLLYRIISIYIIYTCIAARSLDYEAKQVEVNLGKSIEDGRHRLSYIVGRDTKGLNEEEIIRATVETVAENTSDGVIGPLFYIFLLGPSGGVLYKFVNTMDSMLGYKNEKYENLGYFPAKVDDLFNIIPARITALLMIFSTLNMKKINTAFKILLRDRKNHKSPNSGYPEAAVAGILGIELGGSNYYGDKLVEKPTIGDSIRQISLSHIDDTIKIMYKSEIFFILIYLLIKV